MSRNDGRSTRLRHRPSRTVPALVVGILLLAASVALAWACISRLIDGTWSTILQGPRDWLAGLRWDSPAMWGVGVAAAAIGVILLLCAIVPGAFSALTVRNAARAGTDDDMDNEPRTGEKDTAPSAYERETVMTRRAVAHLARAQCVQIDGVSTASATASNKRVNLKVNTSLRETMELRTRVIEDVRDRLTSIGLDPVPRVTASIETKG